MTDVNSQWTWFAPIIIIFIIFAFAFVAIHRATSKDGWYQHIKHPLLALPSWAQILLWFIMYALIAYVWYNLNSTITDNNTFDWLNWVFTLHMCFSLAWWFFFWGDAQTIVGLVLLIMMVASAAWLMVYVISDVLNTVFLSVYLVWLIYMLYFNISVLAQNKINTAPFNWSNLLPW